MKNTNVFKSLSKIAVLLFLVITTINFTACNNGLIGKMTEEDLSNSWISSYDELFTIDIDAKTFSNSNAGVDSYAGNNLVVQFTDYNCTQGYIYFKYTRSYESTSSDPKDNSWTHYKDPENKNEYWWRYSTTAPDVGKWYAVYFKEFSKKAIKISGALGTKASCDTLEDAIEEFTIDKGYFAYYSECVKK